MGEPERSTEADADPVTGVRRYHALDGLRGVAALTVVGYHFLLVVPAISDIYVGGHAPSMGSAAWWLYRTPLRLLFAGHEAVLVFFVLSGFVLTLPLTRGGRWSWTAYYPRRLLRLYVPVWAALVLALVLAVLVTRDTHAASSWLASHKPPTAHATAKDAVLLAGTSDLDSPLWSLRWEMWFSLLLPVMLGILVVLRTRRWWLAATAVVIAISVIARLHPVVRALPGSWLSAGLLEYLPVFAIGMLVAMNRDHVARFGQALSSAAQARFLWPALLTVAVLLALSPSFVSSAPASYGAANALAYAASLVGVALVLFTALEWRSWARVLELPRVQWAGSRSFSIYLVHEPILVAVALLVKPTTYFPWLLIALVVFAAALVVAEIFHRVVERPAQRLSRAVGQRFDRSSKAEPAHRSRRSQPALNSEATRP